MSFKTFGMHHIGITVPDIEEGIAFFKAVFGAVDVFRTGAFEVDEAFMERKLGALSTSNIKDLVFLKCGLGTSVELFEYSGDHSAGTTLRSSEVGGMHLCFEVDDVYQAKNRLLELGVDVLDGPNQVEEGPLAGFNWIYFRAPWGLMLEVASFDRLGYENGSPERLWSAKHPAAD
jgi:catechol 2,3-dioxygenase-like lactoylglutathione lyase family enzyme